MLATGTSLLKSGRKTSKALLPPPRHGDAAYQDKNELAMSVPAASFGCGGAEGLRYRFCRLPSFGAGCDKMGVTSLSGIRWTR